MGKNNKRLVIVGDGEFADIAYEYFTYDSPYEIAGFAVEREYLKRNSVHGLPVVAFEDIQDHFPQEKYILYVAITYTGLNGVRKRLYLEAKEQGYSFANYISSRAFVWRTAEIGENVFIFENNVIQHGCSIGNNVVLWSGNHIGHQTVVQDHVYISSHVVISGYCNIGQRTFIGVNAAFADGVDVGADSFIGMGCGVVKNLDGGFVYTGMPAVASRTPAKRYMRAKD